MMAVDTIRGCYKCRTNFRILERVLRAKSSRHDNCQIMRQFAKRCKTHQRHRVRKVQSATQMQKYWNSTRSGQEEEIKLLNLSHEKRISSR